MTIAGRLVWKAMTVLSFSLIGANNVRPTQRVSTVEVGHLLTPSLSDPSSKSRSATATARSVPRVTDVLGTPRRVGAHLRFLAPQSHYEAQQLARQRQLTPEFKEQYAVRAGVEGTISQAAFTLDVRRACYRGLLKVHFQYLATSAAINLLRVIAWLNEVPRSTTPLSHFARLAA
jgi:hypothetical protein